MTAARNSGLMADYKLFSSRRRGWLQAHKGKVVVVRKGKVLGFYDDYAAGLRAGISAFGIEKEFLVQKVYDDGESVL